MNTRDAKRLVAFPSLSGGLNALPQATSMSNVSLHANVYARSVAKESEAKASRNFFSKFQNNF